MKKLLLLATLLCVSSLTFSQTFDTNGLSYIVNTDGPNTVTLTGRASGNTNTVIDIPFNVFGNGSFHTVTSIGDQAFQSDGITSVTISTSVTSIGLSAFANNQLTTVTIPFTVTSLGTSAFANNQLASVNISDFITTIGIGVFQNNLLTNVTIGNNVTSIGSRAFQDNLLTSVTIGNSVDSIGNDAFLNNQLSSVTIPNSVTTIGNSAFRSNPITSLTIGNSVTSIGDQAFFLNQLSNVTFPDSLISIGNSAFSINQLTNVTFGNGVISIGNNAFNQNQLSSVIIPNSVTTIGNSAFSFNQLTSVTLGNSLTNIGDTAFAFAAASAPNTGEYNLIFIGETPPTIQANSFIDQSSTANRSDITVNVPCTSLASYINNPLYAGFFDIIAPDNTAGLTYVINTDDPTTVTITGRSANNMNTDIVIPDTISDCNGIFSVTNIEDNAFNNNQLTSVIIGDNVTHIGSRAFRTNQLNSVTIGNSVTNIGQEAFQTNLLTTLTIPDNVTSMGLFAFSSNALTSVTIGNGVTNIPVGAFQINQLTNVTFGNGVISIGNNAFNQNQLSSVTIPNSVTLIGSNVFNNNQLTSVVLGNNISNFGFDVFQFAAATDPGTGEHRLAFLRETPPGIVASTFINQSGASSRGDITVLVPCASLSAYTNDPSYTGFFEFNPPVVFTAPADLCIDAGIQTGLSGGLSAGGVYSGPGVIDDGNGMTYSFDPANAGAGEHTITYTFTNLAGCITTASDTLEVFPLPTVTFTAPGDLCLNAGIQTGLSGGTPAVLIESTTVVLNLDYEDVFGPGSGVTGGEIVFDSSGTMISTNLIFFGNANGNVAPLIDATASGNTITLDFNNGPIGTIVADGPIVGASGNLTFISGSDLIIDGDDFTFVSATGTATSETLGSAIYAGPGVTNEASGTLYSFDPAVAGAGTHTITYTYTDDNGCDVSAIDTIEVFALDDPSFSYDASVYTGDDADPTPTITGLAGGTFSADTGLVLNPTTGTIDVSTTTPATYEVTYTIAGNCINSSSVFITVNAGSTQVDAAFCDTTLVTFDQIITCEVIPGATQYDFRFVNQDTLEELVSSNTEASNSLAMANLLDFGALYFVRVRVILNGVTGNYGAGCDLTAPNGCAVPVTLTTPPEICIDAGIQVLSGGTTAGGVYSGPGVTNDGNGMTYSFDPVVAGLGTHTITYEFTDTTGCFNTASNTIEVFTPDDPSFSYDLSVYTGDDADPTPTITGLEGGTFSADIGLVLNPTTGTIDVSTTTPATYEVTYTTSGNHINSSSVFITVNAGSTQIDAAFCDTTLVTFDQIITCEVIPGATQYDFRFVNQDTLETVVSSNTEASNSLALANLLDFGARYFVRVRATLDGVTGNYGVGCELTAPNGCALPVTLTTPPEICIDAGMQVLSGGTTAGGVYSGPGVTDDGNGMTYSFNPEIAGLGAHTITYSFTDAIGCTNTATNTIAVVLDTVVAAFTAPEDVCIDAGILTNLAGGTPEGEVSTTQVFFGGNFIDPNGFTGFLSPGMFGVTFDSTGALLSSPNGSFFRDNTQNIEYNLVDASASGSEILLDFGEFGFGNIIIDGIVLDGPDTLQTEAIISATVVINGVTYVITGVNNNVFSSNQTTGSGSGVYSGPGVTHDPIAMTYDFDPAVAGVGTHTITYTYTAPNGCSDTATDTIEVFDVPTVTFTAPGDLLLDAGVQSGLSGGTPIGSLASTTIVFDNLVFERPNFPDGIINGTSVVDASGTLISTNVTFFHPSVSQIPRPLENLSVTGSEISLDFGTSSNGNFIHTGTITAVGPVLGTTGVVNTSGGALTYNDFIFSLAPNTVFTTTSVGSGVYSGPGVTDNDNGMTYSFDPLIAGVGTHTITYTYTEASGCSSSASDTVVVFIDTCQDIATYDAAGWGAVMPSINNEVIIDADYDTSLTGLGSFEACKVTVNAGATLTIAADDFIFVFGDITVNGTLIIEHTGSVVQVDENAVTINNGSIAVAKTTPILDDRNFVAMSSPVTAEARDRVYGNSRAVFSIIPSNFVPFAIDFVEFPEFEFAENFLDDNNDYLLPIAGSTATPAAGIGQLIFPQPEPNVGDGAYTLTYTQDAINPGTLNSGTISVPINYNGPATTNNYNLLGNPYASAIDVTAFITANDAVNEVYYWDHITNPTSDLPGFGTSNFSMNDISIRNAMMGIAAVNGGTEPGQFMASGQGFGIKADQAEMAAGTPVVFTNSIRVTGNNDGFRSSETSTEINKLWLNLTTTAFEEAISQTGIGFTSDATIGFDNGYDSPRIGTFLSLFTTLETGEQLAIQGREVFDANMEIALGFSTTIEENASYTIDLNKLEGIHLEETPIFLIDHLLGTTTNLKETPYSFTSERGIQSDRFTLIFKERDVLGVDEVSFRESGINLYPNPSKGQITLAYTGTATLENAVITDVNGKIIRRIGLTHFNQTQTIALDDLARGMYFMRITSQENTVIKKLIIR